MTLVCDRAFHIALVAGHLMAPSWQHKILQLLSSLPESERTKERAFVLDPKDRRQHRNDCIRHDNEHNRRHDCRRGR